MSKIESKIPIAYVLLEKIWPFADYEKQFRMIFRHASLSKGTSYHVGKKFEMASQLLEDECFIEVEIDTAHPQLVLELEKRGCHDGEESVLAKCVMKCVIDLAELCEDIENERFLSLTRFKDESLESDDVEIFVKLRIRLQNFGKGVFEAHPLHVLFSSSFQFSNLLLRIFSFLDSNFLIKTIYFVNNHCQRVIRECVRSLEVYNHNRDDIDMNFLTNFINKLPHVLEFRMSEHKHFFDKSDGLQTISTTFPLRIGKEVSALVSSQSQLQRLTMNFLELRSDEILNLIFAFKHLKVMELSTRQLFFSFGFLIIYTKFAKKFGKQKNLLSLRIDTDSSDKIDGMLYHSNDFFDSIFDLCEKLHIFSTNSNVLMESFKKLVHEKSDKSFKFNEEEPVLNFSTESHLKFKQNSEMSKTHNLLVSRHPLENNNWGNFEVIADFEKYGSEIRSSFCAHQSFCVNSFFFTLSLFRDEWSGCLTPFLLSDNPKPFTMSVKIESLLLSSSRRVIDNMGKTVIRNISFQDDDSEHEISFLSIRREKERELYSSDFYRFKMQFQFPELLQEHMNHDIKNKKSIEESVLDIHNLKRKILFQPYEINFNFKPSTFENIGEKSAWTSRNFQLCGIEFVLRVDVFEDTNDWELEIELSEKFSDNFAIIADVTMTYGYSNDPKEETEEEEEEEEDIRIRKWEKMIFFEDVELEFESLHLKRRGDEKWDYEDLNFTLRMHVFKVYSTEEYRQFKENELTEIIGDDVEYNDYFKTNRVDSVELDVDVNVEGAAQILKLFGKAMEWRFTYYRSSLIDDVVNWIWGIGREYDVLRNSCLFLSFTISFPEISDFILRSCPMVFDNDPSVGMNSWEFCSVVMPKEIIKKKQSLKEPLKVKIDFEISEDPGVLDEYEMIERFKKMYIRNNKYLGNEELQESVDVDFTITTENHPYQIYKPLVLCGVNFLIEFLPLGANSKFMRKAGVGISLQMNRLMVILAKLKVEDLDYSQTNENGEEEGGEEKHEKVKMMDGGSTIQFNFPINREKKRWRFRITCKLIDLRITGEDYQDSDDDDDDEEEGEEENEGEEEGEGESSGEEDDLVEVFSL